MATMSRHGSDDKAADRSSASSAAADARVADVPEYVLHDGTVFLIVHGGKKVIVPVFEGKAAGKQTCHLDGSCECANGSQSFEKG